MFSNWTRTRKGDSLKNLRFIKFVATSGFYVFGHAIPKANKIIAKKEATQKEKYDMAYEIVQYMRKHFKTSTYVYGMENIPKEDGFAIMGNHQSKYDALCVFEAIERDTSVLWERGQASRVLSRQICDLLDAVKIDLKDPHDIVNAIHDSIRIIKSGRNMIIFPEGGYTDNHNELQEFNSGCFSVVLKTKAPILPFVLYDAYKSMNTNRIFGREETQIHFLPPITYEVYKDMNKKQLSEYLKQIIEDKLVLLRQQEADILSGKLSKEVLKNNISKMMD